MTDAVIVQVSGHVVRLLRPGEQGPKGDQGPPGSRWYSGAGDPATGLGTTGDWYLNDTNGDVFEKTGISAWTFRDNLTGPAGNASVDGGGATTVYSNDLNIDGGTA